MSNVRCQIRFLVCLSASARQNHITSAAPAVIFNIKTDVTCVMRQGKELGSDRLMSDARRQWSAQWTGAGGYCSPQADDHNLTVLPLAREQVASGSSRVHVSDGMAPSWLQRGVCFTPSRLRPRADCCYICAVNVSVPVTCRHCGRFVTRSQANNRVAAIRVPDLS